MTDSVDSQNFSQKTSQGPSPVPTPGAFAKKKTSTAPTTYFPASFYAELLDSIEQFSDATSTGTPQAFSNLVSDVHLLDSQIHAHPTAVHQDKLSALASDLENSTLVGNTASLLSAVQKLLTEFDSAYAEQKSRQEEYNKETLGAKRNLLEQAQNISIPQDMHSATPQQVKSANQALKDLDAAWRNLPQVSNVEEKALWKQFQEVRSQFRSFQHDFYNVLDAQRDQVAARKEELIAEAEKLSSSTDWAETSHAYSQLMNQWKKAGRAHRDQEDSLWERFRAAQDVFYDARGIHDQEDLAHQKENLAAKQALLDTYASQILPVTNLEKSRQALSKLEAEWEAIGQIPRDDFKSLEQELDKLSAAVSSAEQDQWRKQDPELKARVSQFKQKAEEFAQQAEAARNAGKSNQAETLEQQAQQWSEWAEQAQKSME